MQQIKGLARGEKDSMFTMRYYCLEMFTAMRGGCIVCEIDGNYFDDGSDSESQEAPDPEESPLLKFFQAIFEVITPDMSDKVYEMTKRLVKNTIADTDTFTPQILDCLLRELTPGLKEDRNNKLS